MRIAIIAALPDELKPLVKGWQRVVAAKGIRVWTRTSGGDELIAICGGMGTKAAMRAFAAAEHLGSLDLVMSVGWAGGLVDEPKIGLVMSEVIDSLTGERFPLTAGEPKLRVVTSDRVVDEAEKRRLRQTYGADVVDMEASAVARLAAMRGIPMVCLKAVSDGVGAKLPNINPFIDEMGQMRMGAFLAHVALRPQFWGSLMEMGARSSAVARELAAAVEDFLAHKDVKRLNRTGEVK